MKVHRIPAPDRTAVVVQDQVQRAFAPTRNIERAARPGLTLRGGGLYLVGRSVEPEGDIRYRLVVMISRRILSCPLVGSLVVPLVIKIGQRLVDAERSIGPFSSSTVDEVSCGCFRSPNGVIYKMRLPTGCLTYRLDPSTNRKRFSPVAGYLMGSKCHLVSFHGWSILDLR